MTPSYTARSARPADAPAIARIYNQGIDERTATFETAHRTAQDVAGWFETSYPIVVVTSGDGVVGFASTSAYRPRACYEGIAEFSVYVDPAHRGQGIGVLAMRLLEKEAARRGFWKLLSRVFVENAASRRLLAKCGFREVGVYRRHGRLDAVWRDVVIVERLIDEGEAV
jgi:phosphinothricin acetyltransferase